MVSPILQFTAHWCRWIWCCISRRWRNQNRVKNGKPPLARYVRFVCARDVAIFLPFASFPPSSRWNVIDAFPFHGRTELNERFPIHLIARQNNYKNRSNNDNSGNHLLSQTAIMGLVASLMMDRKNNTIVCFIIVFNFSRKDFGEFSAVGGPRMMIINAFIVRAVHAASKSRGAFLNDSKSSGTCHR